MACSVSAPAAPRLRHHALPPDLAEILSRIADAGKRLKTLSAHLEYTMVTVLENDKSTESGQILFHESKNREILIKIEKPDAKTILLKKNRAEIYNPKINQIQEYDLGQRTDLAQQFFLLGFGKEAEELKKNYRINWCAKKILKAIPRSSWN
jgi:outer membrane lipoprotein-sorting protein